MDGQEFSGQLDALVAQLRTHDPNPATHWVSEARFLDWLLATCTWLLDSSDELESVCENETTARRMRLFTLDRCAAAAAVMFAAGRVEQGRGVLERCAELCPDVGDMRFYMAGAEQPDDFARALRASWLWSVNKHAEAQALAAKVAGGSGPIASFAGHLAEAPTPINSAPSLFTLNGFGIRLYGREHERNDGSHVSVRYATALFVPVFPIDAFRLSEYGEGYRFHGKVPLSTTLKVWKYGMLSVLGGLMLWGVGSSIANSPDRKLRQAVDEVATYEASDPAAALERYEELLATYDAEIEKDRDFEELAAGWVRSAVAAAELPSPLTPAAVDRVLGIVDRHASLPARMQRPELAEPLVAQLGVWTQELGSATPEAADASLELYAIAARFAQDEAKGEIEAGTRAVRMALAEQLAAQWPLEALRQYVQLLDEEPAAVAAMSEIIAGLPASPTLHADISAELEVWAGKVDEGTRERAVALASEGVARTTDPARLELLAASEEAALREALVADPGDQGVIAGLASLQRQSGELDAAVELLESLGTPGLMTHETQYLLASVEFDRGNHEVAAVLLEQMLRNRLPAFEDTRRAYDLELEQLQERLIARAEKGEFPPKYSLALQNQDPMIAREAFSSWMGDEIDGSPKLAGLQAAYTRHSDIVPVAILLGSVQLQRARAVNGEAREELLDAAERAFLAIRSEAGGVPSYHLSLGQVYFRLGKPEEAKAEFQILLDNPDPSVKLMVARGYRDLGQFEQAREISEAVYAAADSAVKTGGGGAGGEAFDPKIVRHQAALMRYLLSSELEERRTWLGRADQNDEYVKTSLLELEGDDLRHSGDFAAADKKYAAAYDIYLEQAERGDGSYNNAALNLLQRYTCTGDLRHVDEAVELMQRAVALHPDSGIVIGNYASTLEFRAKLELLDAFVPVKQLRLSQGEVSSVLGLLARSSLSETLRASVKASSGRQRALDTWAQHEVLSPQTTTAYSSQLAWHRLSLDVEPLTKLHERLLRVEGLDSSDMLRMQQDYVEGVNDERMLAGIATELEERAALRDKLRRPSDATLAVLAQLDGTNLIDRARMGYGVEARDDAKAAIEAFERAQGLWPEGVSTEGLTDALLLLAVTELGIEDQTLTREWYGKLRDEGMSLILVDLHAQGHALTTKLVDHPAFVRSLELRRALPAQSLSLLDLVVAKLAGDDELRARALAEQRAPSTVLSREIGALLVPDDSFPRVEALLDAG